MNDISQLLESALDGETSYSPDLEAIVGAGRRRNRRHRLVAGGSGVALAAGLGTLAVVLASGGSPAPRHAAAAEPTASVVASETAGRPAPVDTTHGITASNLAQLVEQDSGMRLSNADVSVLPPVHDIDLGAGIANARDQYLNVQVTPAGTEIPTAPTCDQLNGLTAGVDWDMYRGACRVESLPGGGYLTIRTARTLDGRYAITQADLVTGDAAGISVEASNQVNVPAGSTPAGKRPADGAVVSHDPPVTADALADLARTLDSQR